MRNLTHRWIQSNFFSPKLGHFFDVQKRAGEAYPNPVWEGTRQERGSELGPRIVYKWFAAKKITAWQAVKAIKWWGKQDRSYLLVCFPKKIFYRMFL